MDLVENARMPREFAAGPRWQADGALVMLTDRIDDEFLALDPICGWFPRCGGSGQRGLAA